MNRKKSKSKKTPKRKNSPRPTTKTKMVVAMAAYAVAVLLFGVAEAKRMKARWDRRRAFYPKPLKRGMRRSGQASTYDAVLLVRAAVEAGDAEPEMAERALEIIRQLAEGSA